jgi:16S rRNA (guanine527-N7)-methyltransferase
MPVYTPFTILFHVKHSDYTLFSAHPIVQQSTDKQREQYELYAAIFLKYADKINLISPNDKEKIFCRHILDGLFLGSQITDEETSLCDMGSGSGIPAIPTAILNPQTLVTAIEPRKKRAAYLDVVKRELCLHNVTVLDCRVEDVPQKYRNVFEVTSCRALGSMKNDYDRAKLLLKPGGRFITFKSPSEQPPPGAVSKQYSLPNEENEYFLVSIKNG